MSELDTVLGGLASGQTQAQTGLVGAEAGGKIADLSMQFAQQMTALLQDALRLKAEKPHLDPFTFANRARSLETRLDTLITDRRHFTDPDNARFAKRLRKHRPHWLRFLYVDGLDATNNQAERMIRPAVITRKTNGCNRTKSGAETHAILASVLVTCHQHSVPILDYLIQLQQFGDDSFVHSDSPLLPVTSSGASRTSRVQNCKARLGGVEILCYTCRHEHTTYHNRIWHEPTVAILESR